MLAEFRCSDVFSGIVPSLKDCTEQKSIIRAIIEAEKTVQQGFAYKIFGNNKAMKNSLEVIE